MNDGPRQNPAYGRLHLTTPSAPPAPAGGADPYARPTVSTPSHAARGSSLVSSVRLPLAQTSGRTPHRRLARRVRQAIRPTRGRSNGPSARRREDRRPVRPPFRARFHFSTLRASLRCVFRRANGCHRRRTTVTSLDFGSIRPIENFRAHGSGPSDPSIEKCFAFSRKLAVSPLQVAEFDRIMNGGAGGITLRRTVSFVAFRVDRPKSGSYSGPRCAVVGSGGAGDQSCCGFGNHEAHGGYQGPRGVAQAPA